MPVIPVLGKLRQKDQEFEVSLAYIVSKKKKKKKKFVFVSYNIQNNFYFIGDIGV
jgi:hypothetical protein